MNLAALKAFASPCTSASSNRGHIFKLGILTLLVTAIAGCKIVVSIPFGGSVTTEDGFQCQSGQTCTVDVTDETFDSTFKAVPAEGYTFTHWRRKPSAFCGADTKPCHLSTTSFGGNSALLDLLASDQEFFLEPVFVQYNVSYWRGVLKQIEAGNFTTDDFLYAINPDVGNCNPGALTGEAKTRALKALNETRSLHRLPAVQIDSAYDTQMQEASLVQKANNYLTHFPDPADECYTASAADGAATSNIFAGSRPSDPASDVFGWTNDSNNVAALMEAGHRRWMLFPTLGFTSYGQVQGRSALKVFGFTNASPNSDPGDIEFVAMPYESYPYIMVDQGSSSTPWSFSMVPPAGMASDFNYFQNATVSVTDNDSGKLLKINDLHVDNKGFGLSNFLSWMVAGWTYDKPYTVNISNISMPGGGMRDIAYPVMVDRFNLLNLVHPLEATDSASENTLEGRFNSETDKDSYEVAITGKKTISGQRGFFVLVYDIDKRLVKSSDSTISGEFAFGKHTIVVSLCNEEGSCYSGTNSYRLNIN